MAKVQHFETIQDIKNIHKELTKQGKIREAELVIVGCHIGLRIGDLLQVTFADVESGWLNVTEEKTGNKRDPIPINNVVAKSAKTLKSWYAKKFPNIEPKYLFQATARNVKRIQPVSDRHINDILTDVTKQLKISGNYGTHSLRKTFGYFHYQKYQDIAFLQYIFGHKCSSVTLRYIGMTAKKTNKMYMDLNLLRVA